MLREGRPKGIVSQEGSESAPALSLPLHCEDLVPIDRALVGPLRVLGRMKVSSSGIPDRELGKQVRDNIGLGVAKKRERLSQPGSRVHSVQPDPGTAMDSVPKAGTEEIPPAGQERAGGVSGPSHPGNLLIDQSSGDLPSVPVLVDCVISIPSEPEGVRKGWKQDVYPGLLQSSTQASRAASMRSGPGREQDAVRITAAGGRGLSNNHGLGVF